MNLELGLVDVLFCTIKNTKYFLWLPLFPVSVLAGVLRLVLRCRLSWVVFAHWQISWWMHLSFLSTDWNSFNDVCYKNYIADLMHIFFGYRWYFRFHNDIPCTTPYLAKKYDFSKEIKCVYIIFVEFYHFFISTTVWNISTTRLSSVCWLMIMIDCPKGISRQIQTFLLFFCRLYVKKSIE